MFYTQMDNSKKRKEIYIEDKFFAIQRILKENVTQLAIAAEFEVLQSVVSRCVKNQDKIEQQYLSNGSIQRKRIRTQKWEVIDESLREWSKGTLKIIEKLNDVESETKKITTRKAKIENYFKKV